MVPELKDLRKKCPQSTIQFSKSGKSQYFQNSFLWLIDYISFNIDTTSPTIYQKIGNYLRILQNFSNMTYDIYVRSYELMNSSHFSPQTLEPNFFNND